MNPDFLKIIHARHSCRAFLAEEVPRAMLEQILLAAAQAPSSTNMQPWEVSIFLGSAKSRLDQALTAAFEEGRGSNPDLHAYLEEWVEPYKSRRFGCGVSLYNAVGIDRQDKAARREQSKKNFNAFGAPVAMVFYQDDFLKPGSILDMGFFLQNLMLAAQALGLGTCPEASLVAWPEILHQSFGIPEGKRFLTGLALGFPDLQAPVNQYRTAREPLGSFARFVTD